MTRGVTEVGAGSAFTGGAGGLGTVGTGTLAAVLALLELAAAGRVG